MIVFEEVSAVRIDWFRVIVDLERSTDAAGRRWSLERIADAMDRSKGWVSNLKTIPDTEPRFHDGLMLLGLWHSVTGKLAPDIPRIRERSGT